MTLRPARAAIAALLILCAASAPTAATAAGRYDVTVTRTQYGIPHIDAKDFASLGYGYAHSLAEDNLCVVMESYVTVSAERSRYFGPDGSYAIRGNGSVANNLNSDFFYQQIKDEHRIEKLLAETRGNLAVDPKLREGVRGYVDGWNAYLRDVGGAAGVPDPNCRGKEWVRPITEMDVWRRFYSLALLASSGVAIDGIGGALPPPDGSGGQAAVAPESLRPGIVDERLGGLGSNAIALGRAATASGKGMLYGNPHFPWEGSERFYQSHLRIKKEKLDVAGGSLLGVPIILIGHTRNMAWSHTVSTARRFTPFELKLVPGRPTAYFYDGQTREMTARTVTVQARTADGSLEPRSRTLYASHHGPILTSILGLPVFPWTSERAFAMGDANDDNFGRLFNHFFAVNRAQSVDEVERILKRYVGIPWVNTIAADSAGNALYADIGSIPNVDDAMLQECRTQVGVALDTAQRLPVLDGSRSACEWKTDADAPAPGIFGPQHLPSLRRDDHVSNMNDSYWLANPRQPIEGYSRIIGEERTQRSLRTRGGIRLHDEQLEAGRKFTLDLLTGVSMSNRVPAADLWQDELVAMCRQQPSVPSQSGPVSTAGACDALAGFKRTDDLDDKGAVLFRRFAVRALAASVSPWDVPFSAADPVNTPRGLNTENPQVRAALGDAINDLNKAGIPLDSPLRGVQFEKRGDEKIPVHGGPGTTGVYNVITAGWNPSNGGHGDVNHGSSFVQAVELTGACPKVRTILAYSQSTNPSSPHYADQNRLYAKKGWNEPPFCEKDVSNAAVRSLRLSGRRKGQLRSVRVAVSRRSSRVRVRFELATGGTVKVTLTRAGKRVRSVTRKRLRRGVHLVKLRALRRGTYRVIVSHRGETRRLSVRR